MFENKIKFTASKDHIEENLDIPKPAKLNIPDWYKELQHSIPLKTVKGCMPFLDTLTIGYILTMPMDYHIIHNVYNKETQKKDTGSITTKSNPSGAGEFHDPIQLGGNKCPLVHKNKSLNIHKFINPWIIKTPPGYSCLFVPPLNNSDDRFSIIVNGDKYPILESTIKRGTPYVQVIPFKREKWKMSYDNIKYKEAKKKYFFLDSNIIDNYKKKFWHKKSWK